MVLGRICNGERPSAKEEDIRKQINQVNEALSHESADKSHEGSVC
jgi:hypothetical protein